jgi:ectoine hydroxylase-related dioxygenase (phytanoyl-CoA dioxygenase family)
MQISESTIRAYQRNGATVIKGLFAGWVDVIAEGIEENIRRPGQYAAENVRDGESGRFFDDYCNWTRISAFEKVVRQSPAASVAAQLMQSKSAQFFHDHVLVKEPGTRKSTPWHQDGPYYFVDGKQSVSFWTTVEPVRDTTLRCVAGSHLWPRPVLPTRWLKEDSFYPNESDYMSVPDPDAEGLQVLEWPLEPGDAIAFHFNVLHGARGNASDQRRRAFSLRFVGDDARFVRRPGSTSPPFPGHNMREGERLREDWFPILIG